MKGPSADRSSPASPPLAPSSSLKSDHVVSVGRGRRLSVGLFGAGGVDDDVVDEGWSGWAAGVELVLEPGEWVGAFELDSEEGVGGVVAALAAEAELLSGGVDDGEGDFVVVLGGAVEEEHHGGAGFFSAWSSPGYADGVALCSVGVLQADDVEPHGATVALVGAAAVLVDRCGWGWSWAGGWTSGHRR